MTAAPTASSVVHVGRPVAPQAVVALADFEDPAQAGAHVVGTRGVLDPNRMDAAVSRLRVCAGYAGGAGQLDAELGQEGWIVEPAHPDDPFRDGDVWSAVLRRTGRAFVLLATMPSDASPN